MGRVDGGGRARPEAAVSPVLELHWRETVKAVRAGRVWGEKRIGGRLYGMATLEMVRCPSEVQGWARLVDGSKPPFHPFCIQNRVQEERVQICKHVVQQNDF